MMTQFLMDNLDLLLVFALFGGYLVLWRIKRSELRISANEEADVMPRAKTAVQKYFAALARALTLLLVPVLAAHLSVLPLGGLTGRLFGGGDWVHGLAGFAMGIGGLALCRLAQVTMGASWRVGIDEVARTGLVTEGVYRWIRNPTYAGLYLLCLGVFVALPSFLVLYWILAFFLLMEFQVRCEEDWLEERHGEAYRQYRRSSKRYVPFLY